MKDEVKTESSSFIPHSSVLVLSLLGILVLLFVTRWGVGVSPDSTVYIDAARALMRGEGLSVLSGRGAELVPLTHYPPLYPGLLALVSAAVGSDPLYIARWLNALVFGANILLAGLSVGACMRRSSAGAAGLAALLVLAAPDMLQVHSMAWTEPLFILFSLSALLLLASYLDEERRVSFVAAAVLAALAFLTRYVGLVTIGAGICGLLFLGGRSYWKRLLEAALFGFVSCLPMVFWTMRNNRVSGGATDRAFLFHPVKLRQLAAGVSTASSWLLLDKVRSGRAAALFLLELVCLLALAVYLWRRKRGATSSEMSMEGKLSRMPALLFIFIILYICFFILTASFIDYDTVFDERALAPVHALGIVLAVCLAHWLLSRGRGAGRSESRLLALLLAGAFVCSYTLKGARWVRAKGADGQGYMSRAWVKSPTVERIRGLPAETLIYTNGHDAVYFLTGRRAVFLPEKTEHGTGRLNPLFEQELAHIRQQLLERNGVLVYFYGFPERVYLPSEEELRERLRLRLVGREADGSLYRAEP